MKMYGSQFFLSSLALAMGFGLTGCGGGGGSSTPVANFTLGGVASAGPLRGADVTVMDAVNYAVLWTGTTDATTGAYSAQIPATTDPLIVKVVGNKSSTMVDEVLGTIAAPTLDGFTMYAAVPGATSTPTATTTVAAHVTPFTNAAYNIVKAKIGTSDANVAIQQANAVVQTNLTNGQNPLLTNPVTDPAMVISLATVSNLTGPDNVCAGSATPIQSIQCTVDAMASMYTPMSANYNTANPTAIAPTTSGTALATKLATAFNALPIATVAANVAATAPALTPAALTSEINTLASSSGSVAHVPTTSITPPTDTTLTSVAKAQAFFGELKTQVAPYYSPLGTGMLNTKATAVNTESRAIAVDGLLVNVQMVDDVATMLVNGLQSIGQGDYSCQKTSTTAATCSVNSSAGKGTYTVAFTATSLSSMSWTTSKGSTSLGSGTASQSGSSQTLSGTLPPMSRYGNSTAVKSVYTNLNVVASTTGNLTTMAVSGMAEDVDANSKDTFSTTISKGTVVAPANTKSASASDWTASNANIVAVFTTPSFTMTGTANITGLTGTTGSLMSGNVLFEGDFAGTGSSYNFFSGKLTLADSNVSNDYGTASLTGTAMLSATDKGLVLSLNMANAATGGKTASANIAIAGVNTIWISSTTFVNGSNAYTINTSSGLTIDGATGNVKDGSTLAAMIKGNMVYYKDGTQQSIL